MKKQLLTLASLLILSAAHAQSDVTIYGIADAAVRYTTNSGSAASATDSTTSMVGGMSQSRIGFKTQEDLGGGLKALAHLEHRFNLDSGEPAANVPFWQLAYVGMTTPYGRITLGRQFNVLLDVGGTTFAPFKFSPYIDAFKPEMGFAFGARQSDMVKYAAVIGGLTFEAQVSTDHGDTTTGSAMGVPYSFVLPNKSRGAMVRYELGNLAGGAAYLEVRDNAGKKAQASTLGGSFTQGKLYLNASVARNAFAPGFGSVTSAVPAIASAVQGQLLSRIVESGTTGVVTANLDRRDMFSFGGTYALLPQLQIGVQYWGIKQKGITSAADGKGQMLAGVIDYAFSKRTDAYLEVDRTVFDDGAMVFDNAEKSRTGTMVGLRHRF